MTLNNLRNIITNPTRVTSNSSTLIDITVLSSSVHCFDAGIFETDRNITDHYGTYVHVKTDFMLEEPYKRRIWEYKKANFTLLNELIESTDWSFIEHGTVDTATDKFMNTYFSLVKSCIPNKFVTIRPKDKPWYNSEIRRTTRSRDRHKRTAILTGKASDWSKYKNLRNKVNNMKKYAKEMFFNSIEFTMSDFSSSNPKQYWKLIKSLVKDNSSNCEQIPPLINSDRSVSITDFEKANTLNDYFVSVSNVDDRDVNLPSIELKTDVILNDFNISEQDIKDVLNNLIINKASGPDEVSHRMLKQTLNTICKPLCTLFNRSIKENIFPSSWKKANVMPLFKKGNKEQPSNYRPISLISCVGKVMERFVF
jgi:hypothetical protein